MGTTALRGAGGFAQGARIADVTASSGSGRAHGTRVEGVIRMGDFEIPIRPIPGTVNELREESRRDREDRARGDAMSRAEEAGRAAAGTGEDLWSLPEESRQRFGTQLAGLDERAGSIPRVDIVFKEDARRDRESTRSRDDSIHDAEQAELRPGLARGDRKPAQP